MTVIAQRHQEYAGAEEDRLQAQGEQQCLSYILAVIS